MGQAFYREPDTPTLTDKSEITNPPPKLKLSLLHPDNIISEPVSDKPLAKTSITNVPTSGPVCCPELDAYRPQTSSKKPSGPCAFVLPNGLLRRGHFAHGNIYWLGECEYDNGNTYYGDWINGKRHGLGKLTEPNGCTYYGWWENDLRHGLGEAICVDGNTYDGYWKQDEKHGLGKITYAGDSGYYEGKWDMGVLIKVHKFVTQFPKN